MRRLGPVTFVALTFALASCEAPAPTAESPGVERRQQPIFGGEFASACQFPSAIMTPVCTATLIHPKVVLLAAHCMGQGVPATTQVIVGENAMAPVRRLAVERCVRNPAYDGMPRPDKPNSADIALCMLREEVTDIPIVPIMSECEYAALSGGKDVTLVGYGVSRYGGRDFGRKRYVETKIVSVRGDGVVVGEPGKGGCSGDSGGPAYIKMPDGTWRVIGPASITFGNPPCSGNVQGGTMYIAASRHIDWLEKESGVDLTPCHNNNVFDGNLPTCANFPTNANMGAGTWDDACRGGTTMAKPMIYCTGMPGDGGANPVPRDAGGGPTPDARTPDTAPVVPDMRPPMPDLPPPPADLPPVPVWPPTPDAGAPPPPPAPDAGTMTPPITGCSCDLGGAQGSGPAAPVALLLAAMVVIGRVRRRR